MSRLVPALACALSLLALAGCGDEEVAGNPEPPVAEAAGRMPQVTRSEIRLLIEERVPVVWQGLRGEGIATEVEPEPVSARTLAAQNGTEFQVLTFASPADAERAWDSVLATEVVRQGGAATRAANVVVVAPVPPDESAVVRRVWGVVRDLAVACRDEGDDRELRGICFEDAAQVGAPGTGTDPGEVAEIGATIEVGALAYTPQISRQLNPAIEPDSAFLPERRPAEGHVWFGVALRVCNEGDRPARASGELALVDAFGQEVAPVRLPASEDVAYAPRTVEPGECLPPDGSVAARVLDGALVLFDAPLELLEDRPVALEVRDGDDRARVALDV